jgi:molybdopterin molybdotransferase
MLELEEAQSLLLARVHPLPEEEIKLSEACGRILASSVRAPIDLPPFDNSAMDGYAVRSEDTAKASKENPTTLKLIGRTAAGDEMGAALRPQSCQRVFTGSVLPPQTTAVVMQEDTEKDPRRPEGIRVLDPVRPWENVRLRGEDVKAGEEILRGGERLNPQKIALASAMGLSRLPVYRKPIIGLIATGNELAEPGAKLLPGQIFESNRVCLAALLESAGASPKVYPIVRDELAATRAALQKAFEECDAVVSSGGVSVGEMDYVKKALEEIGGELIFWKLAIKPGRPFVFGQLQNRFFFGLPGNPVSAFVTFLLLVRPVVLKLQGASDPMLPALPGVLSEPLANPGDRRHFVRVHVDTTGKVSCPGQQASHLLGSLAKANGLVDVPPRSVISAGTSVRVLCTG